MVVLGLGTNLGDRMHHLRLALGFLKKLPHTTLQKVSPVYVSDALMPPNAPPSWNKPYFNLCICLKTDLTPYALLAELKEIEKKVGRTPEKEWGPRIIDIDLLAWDNLIQYDEKLHIPHEHLQERPFALWPLADVAPDWIYPLPGPLQGKSAAELVLDFGSRFDGKAPFHTKQINHRIDTPILMGIVNITPDSFSDGNPSPLAATSLSQLHVEAGAEIIDLGAESTRPFATPLSAQEEWARLEPVLLHLLKERDHFVLRPKISIDTRHVRVAEKALTLGADIINDVSGLADPAMRALLSGHNCPIVFMHHLGIPANNTTLPRSEPIVPALLAYAQTKLAECENAAITKDRLIFDIGIGFGKTSDQAMVLLNHIQSFQNLGIPLLVGHSRKSFLKLFTDLPANERDIETLMLSLTLAKQNVHYLRVHNVEWHARAFRVLSACE